MEPVRLAAIVTVGTELTTGLRQDTNGGEIARALLTAGFEVAQMHSTPDDTGVLMPLLKDLTARYSLVVVTGGLGPTHDDITREAAAQALGLPLERDEAVAARLTALARLHTEPAARERMLRQADVIHGAAVITPGVGSAPGQIVPTPGGALVLLPGPPAEMRPMLAQVIAAERVTSAPVRLRCTGLTESDAQARVEPLLADFPGVRLTLLASPGEVEVVLFGPDVDRLQACASAARGALGGYCFSDDGASLAEVVVRLARERGVRIALAESCTGGMAASALAGVAGASDVLLGGVVAYADAVKHRLLRVPAPVLARHGAVSDVTARAMAEGALRLPGAGLAVSVTGIAGPGGGSDAKPVGLVWFGIAVPDRPTTAVERRFGGDRDAVRARATATALDLLRRALEDA